MLRTYAEGKTFAIVELTLKTAFPLPPGEGQGEGHLFS